MKIYSYCSETHRHMYDEYFVPSLPSNWELDTLWMNQECRTGEFQSDGWMNMMFKKVDYIMDKIQSNWGGWFLFSDCDIQFFEDVADDLEVRLQDDSVDMVAMDDVIPCAGFFATKANKNTLALWQNVKNFMQASGLNDQLCMADILRAYPHMFRCKLLPRLQYFNYNHLFFDNQHHVWDGKDESIITNADLTSVKVHHANYTIGIENKTRMMEIVRNVKTNNLHTTS